MTVDISGLNKDQLLKALWEKAIIAPFFNNFPDLAPPFDMEEAKDKLREDGYADYICGKSIKTNIYGNNIVSVVPYDRDNGAGAFQSVVDALRK